MRPQSTRNPIQRLLLWLYVAARRAGFFDLPWARRLFDRAYGLYKHWVEGVDLEALRRLIAPGTLVIDVGANIGFFTVQFARWVSGGGRVLAIEPEAENLARLRHTLVAERLDSLVEVIAAAATSRAGPVFLEINPDHPGDHRLASGGGRAVNGVTLDALVSDRGEAPVSLIKIDVQGAEAMVLGGAREVLRRFRPALYIEVDDRNLRAFGSSARALISDLADLGYVPCRLKSAQHVPLDPEAVLSEAAAAYADVLFLAG